MADADSDPRLSVVVLCYRSGEFVREFVDKLRGVLAEVGEADYELVLVGNYLPEVEDETPSIVRELAEADSKVRALTEPKQGWMGWDMRRGLAAARGRYIAVIDGDGQMPVSDVGAVYETIRRERCDMVKTFRVTRGDSFLRKIMSQVFNFLFRLLFPGTLVRDVNSKPKIMTKDAYQRLELTSDDWFVDAEIMIQARRHRFRIEEVPTGFLGLTGRRSFVSLKAVFEFLGNLVRYRIREFGRRG